MLKHYVELPRAVHILCLGSFINRLASFLAPFLTLYLCETLGFGEGRATLAMGVFGAGSICAALVGGHLADAVGRKPIMLLGLIGSATVLLALGYIRSYAGILAAIFLLAFVADMYRPAASAMIADLVPIERRPYANSLMYLSVNLGFAIAPVIGGILSKLSFKLLFTLDSTTSLIYAAIIAIMIRETRPATKAGEVSSVIPPMAAFRRILSDRTFLRFCAATLLVSSIYQQAVSTLPLYLKSIGIDRVHYGWIIALNGALIAICQLPITWFVFRFDRVRLIAIAALVTGIGFGLHGFAATSLQFAGAVAIWTIGEMLQSPLVPTIVAELAPVELRARYFGVVSMCFSGGNMLAAPLGGQVLEHFGGRSLWTGCFVMGILAAMLYGSLRSKLPPRAAGVGR